MALDNYISVSFTEAELSTLDAALAQIQSVLDGKTINLSPEQKKQYGSINEENKVLVNKVNDTEANFPEHHPYFLDKAEFDRDFAARQIMESRAEILQSLTEQFVDTKTLLDFDNMNYSVAYYRYMKALSQQEVPGTTSIYENLRQVYDQQISNLQS